MVPWWVRVPVPGLENGQRSMLGFDEILMNIGEVLLIFLLNYFVLLCQYE